ncbi:MAG: response regulator [Candidatus Eisenbacteria bacterium]|nr:response regulator [Candidatus Eisenbacteria bacterium]
MPKARILIAEDEPALRDVLRMQLELEDYEVSEAHDGRQALERATAEMPDLMLLDVMMPFLDGYAVCRQLRAQFSTRHIPVVMLTARTDMNAKVHGLEGGANDYVTKPWNRGELMLRIHNVLEWSKQQRSASPLTGLPGNLSINDEIRRRLAGSEPFALLQVDIDHFKAFNDYYGYARGDQAIQMLSRILTESAQRSGSADSFVGHIGGDDFVVLTHPDRAEGLGELILNRFNQSSRELYDQEDRERGHVEVLSRRHAIERFPLMSLTIALVSTALVPVTHLAELIDIAQELKAHGKGISGSVLVGDRRRHESDSDRSVA